MLRTAQIALFMLLMNVRDVFSQGTTLFPPAAAIPPEEPDHSSWFLGLFICTLFVSAIWFAWTQPASPLRKRKSRLEQSRAQKHRS